MSGHSFRNLEVIRRLWKSWQIHGWNDLILLQFSSLAKAPHFEVTAKLKPEKLRESELYENIVHLRLHLQKIRWAFGRVKSNTYWLKRLFQVSNQCDVKVAQHYATASDFPGKCKVHFKKTLVTALTKKRLDFLIQTMTSLSLEIPAQRFHRFTRPDGCSPKRSDVLPQPCAHVPRPPDGLKTGQLLGPKKEVVKRSWEITPRYTNL